MSLSPTFGWRASFFVAAVCILAGGPQHPRGATMADMLGDPAWVRSHVLVTAGFCALFAGLVLYGRQRDLPRGTRTWLRLALFATALQLVEMVLHTASVVDHGNLVAGRATPVLSAHLGLAVIAYPVFGVLFAGLIVAGARDRALGSRYLAWLGVLGALAHGAAAPLVVTFGITQARILFPMVMLLALWLVFTALMRLRAPAASTPGHVLAGA